MSANQANSAFPPFGLDKWEVSWNRMCDTVCGWRHLVNATEVTADEQLAQGCYLIANLVCCRKYEWTPEKLERFKLGDDTASDTSSQSDLMPVRGYLIKESGFGYVVNPNLDSVKKKLQ